MATDILTLLQQRGLAPKKVSTRNGGEYHGPCPGCGGNDRFCSWPEQKEGGTYYCRQCSKAGDLVQFLMDFENLSFRAASERLGKELKPISIYSTPRIPAKCRPKPPAPPPELPDHGDRPPGKWLEKAQAFLTWSREQLAKHPEQLEYLAKRGIRPAAVEAHGLGYNPGDENGKDLYRPREAWGLPPAEKKNFWIPRGLVIPHHEAGQVYRLRIRREDGEPRYYIIPGSTMQTMVLGEVKRVALVVESELDASLLHDLAGDLVRAVALGSARTKPDARTAALLSQASLILLALDNDEAGRAAIPWWVEAFPQAKRWPVPQGKDPGDSHLAGIDLRAWIQTGFPEGWSIGQGLSSTPSPERKGGPAPRPLVPREVARLAGGKIVAKETFGLKDRDMTPQLTKVRALNPDALLVLGYVEPSAFVYRQATEQGMKIPRYGFTSGSEEQFLRVATSEQMEDVWDLRPTELTVEALADNAKTYVANYTKRFGTPPSPSSPYAYDQVYVLKQAIERAGSADDPKKVTAEVRKVTVPKEAVMKYLPVGGTMFDINGQAYTSNGAFQWQKGKWVYVSDLPSDPAAPGARPRRTPCGKRTTPSRRGSRPPGA